MEISAIDTMWVLFGTMFIFFMHSGFALLETGFSRVKNSSTAWIDNLLDFAIASLVFWAFGYGIMFGNSNPFIGEFNFVAMHSYPDINPTIPSYANVMFHGAICATTAAVVSGAMLERVSFKSFLIYSTIISGFVYPVVGHWAWGGGWLAELGFHDLQVLHLFMVLVVSSLLLALLFLVHVLANTTKTKNPERCLRTLSH